MNPHTPLGRNLLTAATLLTLAEPG
jgi:hypothetical protein